jgi:hypothetical protein
VASGELSDVGLEVGMGSSEVRFAFFPTDEGIFSVPPSSFYPIFSGFRLQTPSVSPNSFGIQDDVFWVIQSY